MAKIIGLTLALVCAAHERVKYYPPRRRRFIFALPSRGERRAQDDHRTVLEIVRSV